MKNRSIAFAVAAFGALVLHAQGGDAAQRAQAEALFAHERFADAMPLYAQLVSLTPGDRDLNYRLGACMIHSGGDKEKAVGFLKFATQDAGITPLAYYQLGRAFHVTYRFADALVAYGKFREKSEKKMLTDHPVDVLEKQCRNGTQLLGNLKEIEVHSKVEVDATQFDRFYDLTDMGGRIIEVPDDLMSALDRKSGQRSFLFKPDKGGTIYFGSYGKDGRTGRDIYATELLPGGNFAEPRKLAGYVNTDQDEDFAFLHADGRTFYFSSKGHNSMGGYDVFRTNYDKGLDVFGSPENMDFAVNTPDDDMLYLVDPEGREACFASARDSKQGNIHVYRVSTSQQPLDLVILKGQYLSSIDPNDRKAHIVVEDATTRKQVADVRTGLDGTYVLALPHSGRYKFMVEAGPGGRTHVGMVEAPRVDAARAYRQELVLQELGGQEKLLIKNYFDEPLADDLIALALEEIQRRSKLNVTEPAAVAEQPVVEKPIGDVMTKAGFAGNVTSADAVQLAQDDARELTAMADDAEEQSGAAFTAALQAALDAEKATTAAAQHIRNADAATDDAVKNSEMTAAAREREHARTANLRAKAALRAGQDLQAEAMAVTQQAAQADRLSTDLATAVNSGNDATSVAHLTALKARLDVKNGPDATPAAHERTRRATAQKENEATRALLSAASRRDEEDELVMRINRLERERDDTNGKSRKEDLTVEIGTYQEQLTALRAETARAFANAKGMEKETAVMRSQSALMKALDDGNAPLVATELTTAQVSDLGQRLAASELSTAALPIDERFEAAIADEVARMKTIANDWSMGDDATASNNAAGATLTSDRNADSTERMSVTQTQAEQDALAQEPVGDRNAGTGIAPATSGTNDGATTTAVRTQAEPDARVPGTGSAQVEGSPDSGKSATTGSTANGTAGVQTAEPVAVPADSLLPSTPDPGSMLVSSPPDASAPGSDPAAQRFLLENQLAEVEQLRAAEKNKNERARLDTRIAELKQQLVASPQPVADEVAPNAPIVLVDDTPTVARPALAFDATMPEAKLVERLFSRYATDHGRTFQLTDPVERANAAHGLELMLVDSLQAEADRQTTVLETAPERAPEILPRIERLRQLRSAHTAQADRYLKEAGIASDASARNINPAEDYAIDPGQGSASNGQQAAPRPASGTAHLDDYVAPVGDPEFILETPINFRSTKVAEAVALRDQDIEQIVRMEEEIDSLEILLEEMDRGKEYEKIRKQADKRIDDRVILRTEMGARSAYLSKQEYDHANDSLRRIRGEVNKLGLAPDEALVQVALQMEEDARTQFTRAQQLRKQADRAEDIVVRDSLFREAFTMELLGLRGLDQAITVNNYMLSNDFARGETKTYAAIEHHMFGPDEPLLAADGGSKAGTQSTGTTADTVAISDQGARSEQPLADGTAITTQQDGNVAQADPAGTGNERPEGTDTGNAATVVDPAGNTAMDARPTSGGIAAGTDPPATGVGTTGTTGQEGTRPASTMPAWNSLRSEELAAQLSEAQEDAQYFERRSIALADSATALRDSMATAKRRDRSTLEQQAVLAQQRSDELLVRSRAAAASSDSLLAMQRELEQEQLFRDRLRQFYYLNNDEENAVTGQSDKSRYFEARSLALDQRERADVARMDAIGTRQLAQALLDQGKAVLANATGAQGATTDEMAKAGALSDRAVQLHRRADSLEVVAARLEGSANMNESQAAALLQGLPAERSTEIMALEQRTRRTEPMLAEARSLVSGSGADTQQSTATNTTGGAVVPATGSVATTRPPASTAGDQGTTGITSAPQPTTEPPATSGSQAAAGGTRSAAEALPSGTGDRPLLPALEADVFTLLPSGDRTARTIALDEAMPSGLVYKVQIGAFRFPIPDDLFSDMTPITGETVGNGMVRYMAGMFTEYGNADNAKEQVRDRGYRDAFVVAYLNGKRISLSEARNVQRSTDPTPTAIAQNTTTVPTTNSTGLPPANTEAAPVVLNTVPVATTAPVDDATVLAKYPASADQVLASFTPAANATDYYKAPGAAPAKQVETIKGLFFTVQVGVYSKPVALDKLFNITPLNSELTETAKVRYTTGVYLDTDKARLRKDGTVALGVKDAFVTAYLNGKRIPIRDARVLLARFGNSVLADPSLATP